MNKKDLTTCLMTPKDWNDMDNQTKAECLVLSFIGYIVRPKNISKNLLNKCIEAFDNNRGKTEKEIDAVLAVIEREI